MGHYRGRVSEVRLEAGRHLEVNIACPVDAIPLAGQYVLASDLDDPLAALGVPSFLTEESRGGFWAAPLFSSGWEPGTSLDLVGPLGHGFNLPRQVQRLGLVALGETISRLMPLVQQMAGPHSNMTLFSDLTLPQIPDSLEAYPLDSLVDAMDWPDFMVFDLPLERLPELRKVLGLADGTGLPCPAQVLVTMQMPCAGLARCGACAVPAHRGWKLACEDGPVFDLSSLKW